MRRSLCFSLLVHWKPDCEHGSLIWPALHSNCSIAQCDNFFDQGQPKAIALNVAVLLTLIEFVKYVGLYLRCHADASVFDTHLNDFRCLTAADADGTSGWSEFDCI